MTISVTIHIEYKSIPITINIDNMNPLADYQEWLEGAILEITKFIDTLNEEKKP